MEEISLSVFSPPFTFCMVILAVKLGLYVITVDLCRGREGTPEEIAVCGLTRNMHKVDRRTELHVRIVN
jgi:hypothetical protein